MQTSQTLVPISAKSTRFRRFSAKVHQYRYLYLLLLPALIFFILFKYIPIYGILIAFKEYNFSAGVLGSEWAGLKYFQKMFRGVSFIQVFRNTVVISLTKLIFGFPAPIVFALLLNEIRRLKVKKAVQTISYLPHFLSWVVLGGVIRSILSTLGPINYLVELFGGRPTVFLGEPGYFIPIVILSYIYRTIGWGSIVYLAAIGNINPQLYEAAEIDGASRIRQMFHVTLPSLIPVMSILFLLRVGHLMEAGFRQILNLYSPMVYSVGDIISTYAYRVGLIQMEYSYSTAVGLFKNVLGVIIMIIVNTTVNRVKEYGIW